MNYIKLKLICQRIHSLRKEKGLKLEQLAYQSEISKGGLSEIERNLKEARAFTILKICASLNISMRDFFDFQDLENFKNLLLMGKKQTKNVKILSIIGFCSFLFSNSMI